MNVSQWLREAQRQLETAGIGTARLDALVLLEDVCGVDRAKLLAEPDHALTAAQQAKLAKLLKRRAAHEPLAYLRGFTEFYGRRFVITAAVLEPRPESETMIDQLLDLSKAGLLGSGKRQKLRLADVGAGSGALGITAKLELPEAEIELLEIDPKALKIAKTNVDLFTLPIKVLKSDLLIQSAGNYDVLLSNLPYVPDGFHINEAALREPHIAIFGGPDGLDLYRKLFQQLTTAPKQPLFILTESLPPQHPGLRDIAKRFGYRQRQKNDFIQVFERSAT